MNAIGYVRLSSKGYHLGIEAQTISIQKYAKEKSLSLTKIFQDIGVPGTTPISKRPGLLEALKQRNRIIIVRSLDRIARNVKIATEIEMSVKKTGSLIVPVDPSISYKTAEKELERNKRNTKEALAVKRTRGERIGGIPYGFELAADGVHLVENEAEQSIRRRVLSLRASGLSLRAVTAECARQGMASRVGRPFALTQIARMVATSPRQP